MTVSKTSTSSFAGLELRSVTIDGKPWFVAADVCRMLGYSTAAETGSALRNMPTSHVRSHKLPNTAGRAASMITEAGVYHLVMRAQKANPKAREFQAWVTGTVLPALRKDGMYVMGEEKMDLTTEAGETVLQGDVQDGLSHCQC